MIQANELRRNNLVNYKKNINKISSISEAFVMLESYECCSALVGYEDVKPIPITKEWLLKFGFKDALNYFKIKHFRIIMLEDRYFFDNIPLTEIKYIHQLQNLYFALTGKELKLNN
jgi:hypothetical protein